ncbi:MAG TPA: HDOD domain-containing protein [Nitrospirales bacterium]|nr:HDOD domain-containing protein [Nitrospirales bacterium]
MTESSDLRVSLTTILAGRPLPIIRQAAAWVLALLSDSNTKIETLADSILHDEAFTARVLHVANSAYYRRQKEPVTTVTQAIAMTGFNTLRDIVVAAEFVDLAQKRLPTSVNLRRLLAKAFVAGHQATALAQAVLRPQAEALFTCALLETLGEFVLAAYLPKVYTTVGDTMQATGLPFEEAHFQATGMTPHEVTEIIFKGLDLPEGLLLPAPVWDVHGTAPDRRQAIVHLTNTCATNLFGPDSPQTVSQFNVLISRLVKTTGFRLDTVEALLSQAYLKALEFGGHVDLGADSFALHGTAKHPNARHGFITMCRELVERQAGKETVDRPLL